MSYLLQIRSMIKWYTRVSFTHFVQIQAYDIFTRQVEITRNLQSVDGTVAYDSTFETWKNQSGSCTPFNVLDEVPRNETRIANTSRQICGTWQEGRRSGCSRCDTATIRNANKRRGKDAFPSIKSILDPAIIVWHCTTVSRLSGTERRNCFMYRSCYSIQYSLATDY